MTIPAGYFAFFDTNGKIDSSGYIYDGKKDRHWFYFDDSLETIQTKTYNKGVLFEKKDNRDTTSSPADEKEAEYKGGERAWRKYLEKNMRIPERTMKLKKNGTAKFSFVVSKNGSIRDVVVLQSVEYSFDEAIRSVLEKAPNWKPALQNGKPVNAYRQQPMTIMTE